MQFITVCDFRYVRAAQRLAVSLQKSGNPSPLVIFCDDAVMFEPLRRAGQCELRVLPEIRTLGAKRAKFTAYTRALAEFGDILYLDSDIIVLTDLTHLHAPGRLRACFDDLSACDFVDDPRHPWPGDPGLTNNCYVNSGVLHIPAALSGFFEHMRQLSLQNQCWDRHIFPGKLYDNHFLCAHTNMEKISIDLIDQEQYNWQGFIRKGELQVNRRGSELVNRRSGKLLHLAHFAGVVDVDHALCSMPVDVGALLCEQSTVAPDSPEVELIRFQASVSKYFLEPLADDFIKTVYDKIRVELLALGRDGWNRSFEQRDSYFVDPESLLSLLYSRPNSRAMWNGLQCGGAYLEGDEYNYLGQVIKACKIETVVETGAGETSICFQMNGAHTLAIEASQGPWLERARAAGCRAMHVPFVDDKCEFEESALESVLAGINEVDLIFIDSPVGTRNRGRVLTQLLRAVHPRLVLFHDTHRDATNLYLYQLQHDLHVVDYLPSRRGMVLFSVGVQRIEPVPRALGNIVLSHARWSLMTSDPLRHVTAGAGSVLKLTLKNRGPDVLSSRYKDPVHVSYHWMEDDGSMLIFDGVRTPLPFDVHPGDSATFEVKVVAPEATGNLTLQVALVQEMITWFDASENSLSLLVNVAARELVQTPTQTPVPGWIPAGTSSHERDQLRNEVLASLHIITSDMEADAGFTEAYERCRAFTITSRERMYAMWQAVRHVSQCALSGDIVECGSWMGGNGMLAAFTLLEFGDRCRQIWLYDTFEGMSQPSVEDVRHDGQDAVSLWRERRSGEGGSEWWKAQHDVVLENMLSTGFPKEQIKLVKGRVEETIPAQVPQRIAVLRLDTDWYESTRHEMVHLFPRLVTGGILILDDYGWWQGSRRAADEYLQQQGIHLLLSRIDACGARLAIKGCNKKTFPT